MKILKILLFPAIIFHLLYRDTLYFVTVRLCLVCTMELWAWLAGGRTFGHRLERGRESSQPLLALTANKCFDIYCPRSQPQPCQPPHPAIYPLAMPLRQLPPLPITLKWPKCAASNVIVVLLWAMHLTLDKGGQGESCLEGSGQVSGAGWQLMGKWAWCIKKRFNRRLLGHFTQKKVKSKNIFRLLEKSKAI